LGVNSELDGYLEEICYIRQDVAAIVANLGDGQFTWRPASDRWSIGECFEHLNLTAAAFIPAIDAAIDDARARNPSASRGRTASTSAAPAAGRPSFRS
jgi:hypothetical protein